MKKIETISIIQPDDWHVHLRDGKAMKSVVADTARIFHRAMVMPNLNPPITTTDLAHAYRSRILSSIDEKTDFNPIMTLYLTDNTKPQEILRAKESGFIGAMKLYPSGATTNSDDGVTDIQKIYPILEVMEREDIPLSVHAEATDPDVDVFDREKVYIERYLSKLVEDFPNLRIIFEHVSTKDGIDFVRESRDRVAGTITAHHLLLNRNDIFKKGICPHLYCLPIVKSIEDQQSLIQAATEGNPKFFGGTDSAPHPQSAKERAYGSGGIYTAHAAVELYAEVFEKAGRLNKLEEFISFNGADIYGYPRNKQKITLNKEERTIQEKLPFGDEYLIPFRSGDNVEWRAEICS